MNHPTPALTAHIVHIQRSAAVAYESAAVCRDLHAQGIRLNYSPLEDLARDATVFAARAARLARCARIMMGMDA